MYRLKDDKTIIFLNSFSQKTSLPLVIFSSIDSSLIRNQDRIFMFSRKEEIHSFHSKVATESDYFSVLLWIEHQGGIDQILQQLRQHDLHHTVDSWLNEGPNFLLYPGQVLNIINTAELDQLAIECRTDLPGAAQRLAMALPKLVDGLSRRGELSPNSNQDFIATGIELLCVN